jgi:hypothetical protein
MLDLRDARDLLDWMRANGVSRARVADLELVLEAELAEVADEQPFDIATLDISAYSSPYEDPDLYPDGLVPMTPKQRSEDSAQ